MKRLPMPPHLEIVCLEADINYTIFHLNDGKKIISSTTLKRHEAKEALSDFLRVNKSYLLNPEFVKKVEKKGNRATIELLDGRRVQVSRRKMGLIEGLGW